MPKLMEQHIPGVTFTISSRKRTLPIPVTPGKSLPTAYDPAGPSSAAPGPTYLQKALAILKSRNEDSTTPEPTSPKPDDSVCPPILVKKHRMDAGPDTPSLRGAENSDTKKEAISTSRASMMDMSSPKLPKDEAN